eukprot:TRINITY_DN3163_c0_g1_i2.p2 TRINITY_DN3163_c0_g1~~TRINITY_DN3163_c0_g1_i2.p2  ORF type:complete len:104 (+),score=40.02 TRINITY_DN3163_c0_g1_i2:187-498(+)
MCIRDRDPQDNESKKPKVALSHLEDQEEEQVETPGPKQAPDPEMLQTMGITPQEFEQLDEPTRAEIRKLVQMQQQAATLEAAQSEEPAPDQQDAQAGKRQDAA